MFSRCTVDPHSDDSAQLTNPLDALMCFSLETLEPYIRHCFDDGFVKLLGIVPGLDMCKQQVSGRDNERHIWRACRRGKSTLAFCYVLRN